MSIVTGNNKSDKLRRSGMSLSPLTGLGVVENDGAINIKPVRGFSNCL